MLRNKVFPSIQVKDLQKGDTFIEGGTDAFLVVKNIYQDEDGIHAVAKVIKEDEILLKDETVRYSQYHRFPGYSPRLYLRSRVEGLAVIDGGQ